MSRAYVRHGYPVWPIPRRPRPVQTNAHGWPECLDIAEFIALQSEARWRRNYLRAHRNKTMRELIGPPEFNGPLYTGQFYRGEIVCGRIWNGVTAINYACIRGMHNACFREDVATLYRYLEHMKRCRGPRLP